MATKIGFDASLANTGVDWVTVGNDVVKTLKQQETNRENTRVQAKQALQEEIKNLAATELGKDAEANQWIMNGVDSITGTGLIDQRLWESGVLSTKDYLRNRANRKNGTELVLQAFNTYTDDYEAIMEGIKSTELSSKTLDLRAQLDSLFDFGKTGIYINPQDGEVNVAKKELVDGVYRMSDNPSEFLNASEMLQAATSKYNRFKALEEAEVLAKSVAQTVLRTVGGTDIKEAYRAVEGLSSEEQTKLKEARLGQVKSILNNEKAGSFLADYLKEGYSFVRTIEEANADEKKILVNQDGSTNFEDSKHGEAQLSYAVQEFDKLLETYLPKTRKEKIVSEKDKSKKADSTKEGNKVSDLAKMQSGTKQERIVSASDAAGRDDSVTQIIETVDDIYFVRTDAKGNVTTTPYPRPESTINWVKGAASGVTDIEDLTKALKFSGIEEGMTRADITEDGALKEITLPDGTTVLGNVLFKRTAPAKKESPFVKLDKKLETLPEDLFTKQTADGATIVKTLQDKYEGLKFTFVEGDYTDSITVTNPAGETLELKYDGSKEGDRQKLIEFVSAYYSADVKRMLPIAGNLGISENEIQQRIGNY
jgi:hypothetical protein